MKPPTPQQFYNSTIRHVLRQGRAVGPDGFCQYRTKDGRSCAVGKWIPDALYKKSLESSTLETICFMSPALKKKLSSYIPNFSLASSLQVWHDGDHSYDYLVGIAVDYGLTPFPRKEYARLLKRMPKG